MQIGLFIQRQVILLPGHQSPGLIGQIKGIILPPDPHHRLRAEISLLDHAERPGLIAFGRGCHKKFTFDLHRAVSFPLDAGNRERLRRHLPSYYNTGYGAGPRISFL